MCYCKTLKGLSHLVYVRVRFSVCVCFHACILLCVSEVWFLSERRECVHVMAHGYLRGQFYATFQLLPKFVFSS